MRSYCTWIASCVEVCGDITNQKPKLQIVRCSAKKEGKGPFSIMIMYPPTRRRWHSLLDGPPGRRAGSLLLRLVLL